MIIDGIIDKNVLSLNGRPVGMVSQGETLAAFPNRRSTANKNQPQNVVVEIRLNDDMLDARIVQGAGQVVIAAAPGIVKQPVQSTAVDGRGWHLIDEPNPKP